MKTGSWTNNRGIALLIVLLVTALLIALIFEFAYATRISLNSAVNFRDSQRAYFLARAGVYAAMRYPDMLTKNIRQRELVLLPFLSEGDTRVWIAFEDEQGKISIPLVVKGNDAYKRLQQLFDIKAISQDVLDTGIVEKKYFYLVSELHQVMTDEDYVKVKDLLTVVATTKININTASLEVLQSLCRSLGKDDSVAGLIINRRNDQLFTSTSEITNMPGMEPLVASYLDVSSNIYKVYSDATVGGYTRKIEAIFQTGSTAPLYWREL